MAQEPQQPPFTLCVETSGTVCSVAVSKGEEVLAAVNNATPNVHASQLTIQIANCLTEAGVKMQQLGLVAVSAGPGSYTGLRIGYGVAKGLCYTLNLPLVAVDTLQSLANGILLSTNVKFERYISLMDARRNHVYAAVYDASLNEVVAPAIYDIDGDSFQSMLNLNVLSVAGGSGAAKCTSVLRNENITFMPDIALAANYMATLAYKKCCLNLTEEIAYCEPRYVSEPELKMKKANI